MFSISFATSANLASLYFLCMVFNCDFSIFLTNWSRSLDINLTSLSLYVVCFARVELHRPVSSPLKIDRDAYRLTAATRDGFSLTRRQSRSEVSVKYYASKSCFSFAWASRAKRSTNLSVDGNVTENCNVLRIWYSIAMISSLDTALSVTLSKFFNSGG